MSNPAPRIMINGVLNSDINVMDRGFQYGDGLFETMHVINKEIPLWKKHWQRLKNGCDVLSITLPDQTRLEQNIDKLTHDVSQGVVKLIVTRGIGGRGYSVNETLEPEVVLIQTDYPDYPAHFWKDGVQAQTCTTRLSHQPVLAGLKHMNRLEQVMARKEWTESSIAEGIMLDQYDNVIEGTMSNLFIVKNGSVYTSELNFCGVAGVMRETVLAILQEEQIPCVITKVSQDMLASADEVFLTNSVIGLWPIKKIDDTVYTPGEISRKVQKLINNIKNA